MALLKEGEKAPGIQGYNQDNKQITFDQFPGKKIILYFYPKDNTPGCTSEACNLRDNYEELRNSGFEIIGVSPDTPQSHQKFITKNNLPFHLISDPEKQIIKAYGAWGEKKMFGKIKEGLLRSTFIISEDRTIEKVISKVKTKDHTEQIKEAMNK